MPAQIDDAPAETIRVTTSAVSDLGFCLFVVEKRAAGRGRWSQEWVTALETQEPELTARIEGFWHDPGYYEWAELSLIGDAAGVLFDDRAGIDWAALERAAAANVPVGSLATEEDDVRELMVRRLRELHDDATRRSAYFELLKAFWVFLAPFYEREGRPAAVRLAAEIRDELAAGRELRAILPPNHLSQLERFAPQMAAAEREGRIVIVALGLSGIGSGLLDLPGGMVVSYSPETRNSPEQLREVAERIAGQMKVLSDPTRVTLLLMLVHGPRSITDLARTQGLSQPTVSVHVKILREAGLLDSQGGRGKKLYFAPPERVRELLQGAIDEVQTNVEKC